VAPEPDEEATRRALETEREFVLALGGFALEIAGATLVTHEKLPSPRFNFVEVGNFAPERQTAFFERALDHYFQRALRPTFRVRPPVAAHLDAGLRRLGFRPRAETLDVLAGADAVPPAPPAGVSIREARRPDLDTLAAFWANERERPEWRSALEILWSHPNPGERLRPVIADGPAGPVAAALVYCRGAAAGIYAVSTQPGARGQGAASAVAAYARSDEIAGPDSAVSIFADSSRLRSRLERLGFRTIARFTEYALPPEARLEMPSVGPPSPPRWRPPRPGQPGSP